MFLELLTSFNFAYVLPDILGSVDGILGGVSDSTSDLFEESFRCSCWNCSSRWWTGDCLPALNENGGHLDRSVQRSWKKGRSLPLQVCSTCDALQSIVVLKASGMDLGPL